MADHRESNHVDFQELRARAESIGAGVRLTLVICAAGWLYVVATWDRPDRQLIASLFGIGAVVALLFVLIPHERVVRSRWREPFFLLWSVTQIALTTVVVAADGGSTSPLALLFFIPVVFAALTYPLASVVAIGALDYVAYVAVGVAVKQPDPEYVGFFALCLACIAVLCGWHARNQDRRRAALSLVSRADPLTGCLNRRGFEERFEAELSRSLRSGRPVGLIMLDLDHFKNVNDTRGHAAGDEILRWAVDVMDDAVRPMDTIGRVGGDEFAVIVPGAGPDDTGAVARRIVRALEPRAPASAGVAVFPADGADGDELQRAADAKLYAGKRGRGTEIELTAKELSWATALARAVDDRMAVQHEHSWKVAELAVAIAARLGWSERDRELLQMAAILHDVGKVSIPDHILRKRQPLTDKDWEAIRQNPVRGAEMASRIQGLERIVPWIRHSLERYDGSGYPVGLRGEDIPLACRILHVADAFDAMTCERPYRPALSPAEARAELRRQAGAQFDPRCVEILDAYLEEKGRAALAARPHGSAGA
jgi:diguanylate cyclase (GGDEF)-like protein/putative nucleotidyltransferase with HDIG domain